MGGRGAASSPLRWSFGLEHHARVAEFGLPEWRPFSEGASRPCLGLLSCLGSRVCWSCRPVVARTFLAVVLAGLNFVAYRLIHQRHEEVAKRTSLATARPPCTGRSPRKQPPFLERGGDSTEVSAPAVNGALRPEHGGRCVRPPVAVAPIAPIGVDGLGLPC